MVWFGLSRCKERYNSSKYIGAQKPLVAWGIDGS